jgi:hypothetical protein
MPAINHDASLKRKKIENSPSVHWDRDAVDLVEDLISHDPELLEVQGVDTKADTEMDECLCKTKNHSNRCFNFKSSSTHLR